jgi:hypothetical protein
MIEELTQARDGLARADSDEAAPAGESSPSAPPSVSDGAENPPVDPAVDARARRQLPIQSALQASQKNAEETRVLTDAFVDIEREYVNNRVSTEELSRRLLEQIIEPLGRIHSERFPEWEAALTELRRKVDNPQAEPAARRDALASADRLLTALDEVRRNMLQLESYNEVVEMLRGILQDHQRLQDATRDRSRRALLDP